MSSQKRKQALILVGLLAVLGVLLVRPFLGSSALPGSLPRAGNLAALGEELPSEVELLDLDLLERKPATFTPGRDPFRFEAVRKPPPPPPPRPAAQPAPAAAPPRPRPQQPARPQPPPVDFTFLGSFGPDGGRIAVFTDQAEIYNARVGEVVKERFVVREIGYESADIGFVNFPEAPPQRLAIGGRG